MGSAFEPLSFLIVPYLKVGICLVGTILQLFVWFRPLFLVLRYHIPVSSFPLIIDADNFWGFVSTDT